MEVSVVIPTFNRQEKVLEAISSARSQTFRHLDIIVVDDHSEDNTREVVQSIDDERVRYVLNRRSKGAQGARNTGIKMAKGEWIAFLDSDDLWHERKIERQLEYAEEKEEHVYSIYSEFERVKRGEVFWRSQIGEGKIADEKQFLYSNPLGGFTMFMVRREVIRSVGGLDERLGALQDRDVYYRISKQFNIYNVPEHLSTVNESGEDRISDRDKVRLTSVIRLFNKYKKDVQDNNDYTKYCMKADIAQYAALSREWRVLVRNILYVFLAIFICSNKVEDFIKSILLRVRIVEEIRCYFSNLWLK